MFFDKFQIASIAALSLEASSVKDEPVAADVIINYVRQPKTLDLQRTVTYEAGNTVHQSVDDQQGQVTDQYVTPEGIRQVVRRKGVVVLDQIVKTDGTVKQLVP